MSEQIFTVRCSGCNKKINNLGYWVESSQLEGEVVSYGFCEDHFMDRVKQLAELKNMPIDTLLERMRNDKCQN